MTGPNGRPAYFIACSGMGRTLAACYDTAGRLCPDGYTLVDRVSTARITSTTQGGVFSSPQHSMLIECN